jgi:hypothetical protein
MTRPEDRERENFLTRWSSRKRASRTPSARQDAVHAPRDANGTIEDGAVDKTAREGDAQDKPPFDVAQLPSIDSIGPETDIAGFLRKEVPPELTRAALRRAWTSDPAIKNFVGLVENGWDFNDPSAMAGFGTISPEEVARLAGKVIEALPEPAPENQTKEASASERKSQRASTNALPAGQPEDALKTAEPERGAGHDAAQQSKMGNKS